MKRQDLEIILISAWNTGKGKVLGFSHPSLVSSRAPGSSKASGMWGLWWPLQAVFLVVEYDGKLQSEKKPEKHLTYFFIIIF